ncbi:MAG: phosphoribosylformylglycinamidine synthase subunit PurS [Nitrospirota bacterium]
MIKAKVYVTLKKAVLDPQGKTIKQALEHLGFKGIEDIRLGKYMEIAFNGKSEAQAESDIKEMCEKLLANTVIEDYRFEIEKGE